MATVEAASASRVANEGRVVVLSESLMPHRRIAHSDDLLLDSLRSAGVPARHVAAGAAPPELSGRDVCFDALGVWLSDAHSQRLAAMTRLKRDTRFAWIKLLRGDRLPRRYAALPEERRNALRRALGAIDHLVVDSDAMRGWIEAEFPVRCPVQCINGLLPIPPGYLDGAETANLARFLSLHPQNVCCPGVFEPDSGFDQAADAVDQICRATGNDVGLVLLTLGPRKNQAFARRVLAERPWIACAEGLDRIALLRIIARCDAMVRCARREHCGLLRVEAVRLGTPVVAVRACGETRGMRLFDFGSRYQLVAELRRALGEGKHDPQLGRWSEFFQRVAQSNAAEWKAIALRYLARARGASVAEPVGSV